MKEKELGKDGRKQLTGDMPFTADKFFEFKPGGKGRNYAKVAALDSLQELHKDGFYVKIWNADGGVLYSTSESIPKITKKPDLPSDMLVPDLIWNDGSREVLLSNSIGDTVLIGYPSHKFREEMATLRNNLIGLGFLTIVVTGSLGWYLNSVAIRPIKAMSESARAIAAGDLSHRAKLGSVRDELGDLAGTLNSTFDQLELSLTRQKQFVADASHELRTPLAIILNELEWGLEKKRSDEEYRKSIKTCQGSAEHMKKMVNSLLDLAKLDSGDNELKIERVPLDELVEEIVRLLEPMADLNEVQLKIETEPVMASVDPTKIKQVVINLVSNAVQHSPHGSSIHIRITTNTNLVVLEVADQGSGIEQAELPHIFDRFYRSDKARIHVQRGTGLGLAVSRSIARAHQGDLAVESKMGSGSTFLLTLPKV